MEFEDFPHLVEQHIGHQQVYKKYRGIFNDILIFNKSLLMLKQIFHPSVEINPQTESEPEPSAYRDITSPMCKKLEVIMMLVFSLPHQLTNPGNNRISNFNHV